MKALRLSLLRSHAGGLIRVERNRLYSGLHPGLHSGLCSGLAGYKSLNWRVLGRSCRNWLRLNIGVLLKARFNAATKRIFHGAVH